VVENWPTEIKFLPPNAKKGKLGGGKKFGVLRGHTCLEKHGRGEGEMAGEKTI